MRPIPYAVDEPTVTVEEVAGWLGVSRQSAYKAAQAGELPMLRIGRRMLITTAPLRRMLYLPDAPDKAPGSSRQPLPLAGPL